MKQSVLIRSGQEFKRLERAAKAATHAALELSRAMEIDTVGRYSLAVGEQINSPEMQAFLASAAEQCQGMSLDVIVIAREAETGERNGR